MPNGASVYDRFFWYLRLLTYNGFAVIIDNHLNSDPTIVNTGVETWFSVRYVLPSATTYVVMGRCNLLCLCRQGIRWSREDYCMVQSLSSG